MYNYNTLLFKHLFWKNSEPTPPEFYMAVHIFQRCNVDVML